MPLPSNFNNNIIRLNVRCPICASVYDWQRLKILGERDNQVLTFIDCGTCSTAVLSILSLGPSGMTAQGLVTDLTFDEVFGLDERPDITTNDALDMHEALDENDQMFFQKP
jgi:hypothetical protein